MVTNTIFAFLLSIMGGMLTWQGEHPESDAENCEAYQSFVQQWISDRITYETRQHGGRKSKELREADEAFSAFVNERLEIGEFVCSPRIREYVDTLVEELCHAHPFLVKQNLLFLISKDPSVNASAIGHGVVVLNAGLLWSLHSREELLYVIGHEIAHNILDHGRARVEYHTEVAETKADKSKLKEIVKGSEKKYESLLSYLETLQLESKAFSRAQEYEADSLSMILVLPIVSSPSGAYAALAFLDTFEIPEVNWRDEFVFDSFPFRESWLFVQKPLIEPDPIEKEHLAILSTHPHVTERIARLQRDYPALSDEALTTSGLSDRIKKLLRMESIHYLVNQKRYVQALHQSIAVYDAADDHEEGCLTRSQIFLELYQLRMAHRFNDFIPQTPVTLSNSYDDLVCILNNMRTKEILQIGWEYLHQCNVSGAPFTELKELYNLEISK
jgi:hypothetical protein